MPNGGPMGKKTVLVVDDERNVRRTVRQALGQLDVEVIEAVTGEEALEVLQKERVSLVLLDFEMPGISGLEVLRTIRKNRNNVKVIMMTGQGTIEDAVEAMKLDALDFVQKPFTAEELRSIAEDALRRSSGVGFLRRMAPNRENDRTVTFLPVSPIPQESGESFEENLERTRAAIKREDFDDALSWVKRSISADPSRPEGYNIIGVLYELENEPLVAQKYYRAALSVDPTYEPAAHNLSRTTSRSFDTVFDVGGGSPDENRSRGNRTFFRRRARPPRK